MDATDFSQLASSSLPSLGGDSENPSWNRSLRELKVASESLMGSGRPVVQNDPSTQMLIGSRLPELSRLSSSLRTTTTRKDEKLGFESAEQMVQRKELGILDRIVRQQQEETQRRSREMMEKQLQDDWAETREMWLKEMVGTRTLGGVAGSGKDLLDKMKRPTNVVNALTLVGPAPTDNNDRPVDPKLIQSHLEIIQHLNRNKNVKATVDSFLKVTDPSAGTPQESCYGTAWQLISSIIERSTQSPIEGAVGAIEHLCNQFQTLIVNRVRKARLAGQDATTGKVYSSSHANNISSFVKLELGPSDSPWPELYYSLRSGDAIAAKEILSVAAANHNHDVDASVIQVVSALAQHQSSNGCLWSSGIPMLSAQDRRSVADLYERCKSLEVSDIHQTGTLSLLSAFSELPVSDRITGFSTIEDYLFGGLSKALQQQNPAEELSQLGMRIRHFGPDYFGDQESGGWSYALPLLTCQQYSTALSYLANSGGPIGLLQATHLGLALSLAGVSVEDFGSQQPASKICLATSLIVAYATLLQSQSPAGSDAALEYIVRIPDKAQVRKEVSELVIRSTDFTVLGGSLSPEGTRTKGALDQHFSQPEVSIILAEAAETLFKDENDRKKCESAGMLFMLAGHYRSVLIMLNHLLAPPEKIDENRRFWYHQTRTFHDTYLNKRSHVLEVLEREGNLNLISTSRVLLGLHEFFEKLYSGAFSEAWYIVEQLDLLPKSRGDISAKESRFRGLDVLIQKTFPFVLKGSMEALNSQFRRVKADLHGGVTSTLQAHLKEIKERASLLISLAGLLPNVGGENIEGMSRLEALMI